MKSLVLLVSLCLLLVACSDEGALTGAEREWCSIPDASEESALKFDRIFEAGVGLGLQMDVVNAQAARLSDENVTAGMSLDEAARAVSAKLLETDDYVSACQAAFASCSDDIITTEAQDVCPVGSP